jgi:hypothetical protein
MPLTVRCYHGPALVAAGVVLRRYENQSRARFHGTRLLLGSSAESVQDADDRGISG